jgi:hypothetical protein
MLLTGGNYVPEGSAADRKKTSHRPVSSKIDAQDDVEALRTTT